MKKIAFFGFTGELMCFAHILFNAEQMLSEGYEVKIIIEGRSTSLLPALDSESNPFLKIYSRLKENTELISVCQACANKMGTLEYAKQHGYTLESSLYGHPSILDYQNKGYEIITV